jgi:hypothetical protein
MKTQNIIDSARLRPLRSHQQVAMAAASNCTAGWPDAGSWEAKATQEGRWITADPTTRARSDSLSQSADNFDGLGAISFGGDAALYRVDDRLEDLIKENQAAGEQERLAWYELDTAKRLRRAQRMRQKAMRSDARVDAAFCTDFACVEYPEAPALRVDGRMDGVVATKAINVVHALAALSKAWPRLSPRGRALAQQATYLASLALKQAGVSDQTAVYGEAI